MAFDVVHVIDPTEPAQKLDGMLWINPEEVINGMTATRVWDADNGAWVQIGGEGPPGPIGPTGPAGMDGDEATALHAAEWDAHWKPFYMVNDEDNPSSPGAYPDWAEVTGVRCATVMPVDWGTGFFIAHATYENEWADRSVSIRIKDPEGSYSPEAKSDPTKAFGRTYLLWQSTTNSKIGGPGHWSLEARSNDNAGAGNFARLTVTLFRLT